MKTLLIRTTFTLGLGWVLANALYAEPQLPPKLNYVMPMGAKVGTTIEITCTGENMEHAEGLYFSFPGVKVELVGDADKSKLTAPKNPGKNNNNMKAGPQLAQKFKVTLPPNAPLGIQDVRLLTKGGISNPRSFVVGDLAEHEEKEPNNQVENAQKIDVNSTVNGLIPIGTDVDFYQFTGKKGQRIIASCLTSSIDSRLPVMLELYSVQGGNYLASNKGYQGNDALVDAVLPADGDYYVRVFSFSYTLGGPEYFYRLSVSTAPWIDAAYPAVIDPTKETQVTLYGRNLPGGTRDPQAIDERSVLEKAVVKIPAVKDPLALQRLAGQAFEGPNLAYQDGFAYSVKNAAGNSNSVLIGYSQAPLHVGTGKNLTSETAQQVTLPCEVAGKIERKGGQSWFRFEAKKGQVWTIEALGDRLGSPVDLVYRILNEKNQVITEQDDNPDTNVNYLYNKTDDPATYRWKVAEDGVYKMMVTSRYAQLMAGARHGFIIRIAQEHPDFRLVAMPANQLTPEGPTLHSGSSQLYTILAQRTGGFAGDITLSGAKLPGGVTMPPQVLSSTQKVGVFSVQAAADAPPYAGPIQVFGTAMIDGKKVVREVRAATISWPITVNNLPTISRMDRELVLAVREKASFALIPEKNVISVPLGEKVNIPIKLSYLEKDFKQPVNVAAVNAPAFLIQPTPLTLDPGKMSGTLTLELKGNIPAGNYTIALRGQTQPFVLKNNQKPTGVNYMEGSAPISLTIVPKSVAKVSITNATKMSAGKTAEIVVKLARLAEYTGPFEVELVDGKGFTANKLTIKANEDEGKITVTAPPTGNGPSTLTFRATAMFNNQPITHEVKAQVAVSK